VAIIAAGLSTYSSPARAASKKPPPLNTPTILARVPGGWVPVVSLSHGRIYFDVSGTPSELRAVSPSGGEIVTVSNSVPSFINRNGNILGSTYNEILSIPETAEGITTLSRAQASDGRTRDLAIDGETVYWAEQLSINFSTVTRILRIPVVATAEAPIGQNCGCSTDRVFASDLLGVGRLVLDGKVLFVSEGQTGKIYRYDLASGALTQLTTVPSSGPSNAIPLVITTKYLYALIDGKDFWQIDKVTGSSNLVVRTTVPTASRYPSWAKIRSDSTGVYWWEAAPGAAVLKRFDEATGSVATLVTMSTYVSGASAILDFYSDGTWVWWANETGYNTADVQRVPVTGGASESFGPFIGELFPSRDVGSGVTINGDADNVYWATQQGGLAKLPKQGGSAALVSKYSAGLDIITEKYVIGGGIGIRKTPKQGTTEPTILWSRPGDLYFMDITADDSDLYWLMSENIAENVHIYTMPLEGGTARHLASLRDGRRIIPYKDYLLVAKGGSISIIPKNGGDEQVLIVTDPLAPAYVTVFDDMLYFSVDSGGIYGIGLTTGAFKAYAAACSGWLYVDPFHIYCSDGSGVHRVSLSNGLFETVDTTRGGQITGDDRCVYWGAMFELLSFVKTSGACGDPVSLQMAPTLIPDGEQGLPYSANLHAIGGDPPYLFTLVSGSLPPGLTLEPDGTVTGIPAKTTKKSSFGVAAMDSGGTTVTGTFRFSILKPVQIVSTALPSGKQGKRYSTRMKGANGKPPYVWLVAGSLPPGLDLDPTSGILAGNPSAPGIYTFTIEVIDNLGLSSQRDFTLSVQ
jgi:hypothetical protein